MPNVPGGEPSPVRRDQADTATGHGQRLTGALPSITADSGRGGTLACALVRVIAAVDALWS
jgi:hypothetical protein